MIVLKMIMNFCDEQVNLSLNVSSISINMVQNLLSCNKSFICEQNVSIFLETVNKMLSWCLCHLQLAVENVNIDDDHK